MAENSSNQLRTYSGGVALITGGASGIGAALARGLVAQGASVVLADRQRELVESVAQGLGSAARPVELDVRDREAYDAVVEGVMSREGRIDYFFNNAGIGIAGFFEEQSIEDWQYIVDVNLMGVVYGAHAVYKVMLDQGFGHIVNTASMAGLLATPGLSSYSATKHAVVGLSRSMRVEGARRGVRVSAFCPGVIRTEILNDGGVYGKFSGQGLAPPTEAELDRSRAMNVDAFAAAALKRVAANDEIIILPRVWRIFRWLDRFFPSLLSNWSANRFFKEYERLTEARSASDTRPAN